MSFRFQRGELIAEGLRRLAREQAEQALAAAAAMDREPASRVHNARKCTKKLRSVLRLARPHLGDRFRIENVFIRDAARRLSGSRDATVLLATLDALVKKQADDLNASTSEVRAELIESVLHDAPAACSEQQLAAFADDMRELLERIDEWAVAAHGFDAVRDGFLRSYRDGHIAKNAAVASGDSAAWHEWRKRVKDHWYHVRLLRNIWKSPLKARQNELEKLSDLLGEEHDLAVLQERLADLPQTHPEQTAHFVEAIEFQREKLRANAQPLGARLYAEKPKALGKRLHRYWRIWQDET